MPGLAYLVVMLYFLFGGALANAACRSSDRRDIEIFQYAGTRSSQSQDLFDSVRFEINGALEDLGRSMQSHPETSYISSVSLVKDPPEKDNINNAAGESVVWKDNHRFLLIRGTILPPPGAQSFATVMSRLYLGELKGSLPDNTIMFRYTYNTADLADFGSVIISVIDYVLAMDAKSNGCDVAYKNLITLASGNIAKITTADPALEPLKQAIKQEINKR